MMVMLSGRGVGRIPAALFCGAGVPSGAERRRARSLAGQRGWRRRRQLRVGLGLVLTGSTHTGHAGRQRDSPGPPHCGPASQFRANLIARATFTNLLAMWLNASEIV